MTARPLLLVLAAGLLGCPPSLPNTDPLPVAGTALYRFRTCDELREHVTDSWVETLVQSRYGEGWYGPLAGGDDVDNGAETADAPSSWSETNVQEQGVDEPDLVKTNGENIFVAQAGELTVLDSWPPEDTAVVASLPLDGYPFALFLVDDVAVVLSNAWAWDPQGDSVIETERELTRVQLVDVSTPSTPVLERTIELEGMYVDARRIDGDLYVVIQRWLGVPNALWELVWSESTNLPEPEWEASEERRAAIRAEAREILEPLVAAMVNDLELDALLPLAADYAPGDVAAAAPLLSCNDVYRPPSLSGTSTLSLVHVDLEGSSPPTGTGLLADGWTVYASSENLYVAQAAWWWWWGWEPLELTTQVHRFSLDGAQSVYEASGEVPGSVLNRFSMGEWDDHLRIATTDIDWWWGAELDEETQPAEPANNVFVLEPVGAELQTVGSLRGIEPGEQIYAARFVGEKGYLVTFEVIDPLFTLDLSDHTAPTLVGELEIPGFSSYLHPIEDDRILAVGMDATETGQQIGFSISLFDVSDFAAPALADRLTVAGDDWSWSESLWDPHAFTYFNGILSVPVYTWEGDQGFSGLLVVDVGDSTLTEIGRVDHADLVADSRCLYGDAWGEPTSGPCDPSWWYADMRRSLVIDEALYSLSDYGMKVTEHDDPSVELARVLFWPLE